MNSSCDIPTATSATVNGAITGIEPLTTSSTPVQNTPPTIVRSRTVARLVESSAPARAPTATAELNTP